MTKKSFLVKLGAKIARLREERNMSQKDLAYNCDWDKQALYRIEKGLVNTSIYNLYRIAEELDISLSELLK